MHFYRDAAALRIATPRTSHVFDFCLKQERKKEREEERRRGEEKRGEKEEEKKGEKEKKEKEDKEKVEKGAQETGPSDELAQGGSTLQTCQSRASTSGSVSESLGPAS